MSLLYLPLDYTAEFLRVPISQKGSGRINQHVKIFFVLKVFERLGFES